MDYSIWSQGIDSDEYAVVIQDGAFLGKNDPQRDSIRSMLDTVRRRGRYLISTDDLIKVSEHKSIILLETVSENKDRLGRRVPVNIILDSGASAELAEMINESLEKSKLRVSGIDATFLASAIKTARARRKQHQLSLVLIATILLLVSVFYFILR